jgi:hypothetical protein
MFARRHAPPDAHRTALAPVPAPSPARHVAFALAIALAAAQPAPSHAAPESAAAFAPRLVRVALDGPVTLHTLLEAGFDITEAKPGGFALVLEWPGDEARLAALGAEVARVSADPAADYARRAEADLRARAVRPATRARGARGAGGGAPPIGSGSMGGFWTLDEVKLELDALVANDVHGVVADRLDTVGTSVQGRPIWGLRIGTTVPDPDTRPVVFYNALTHAREPGGMQSLFYFVEDLIAGYGVDPFSTYLLEQRVIYVVPVVNPDGYARNQATHPAGGGLWRKNLRDNDLSGTVTSADGVDLNRNFGYQWGFNNVGSNPSPSSSTYRGPSAFSEPESRAQRDLVIALRPRTGISFHTYSDLLLHPWGWSVAGTEDSVAFQIWSDECTLGNAYGSGPSPRVLYEVNGEFNDWCYGETAAKPRAFTWTPEVGTADDGFWPPPSRIEPLARENLRMCYTVAAIAGLYVRVESVSIAEGALNAGGVAHLAVRARNLGLDPAPAGLAATLSPLDPAAVVLGATVDYPAIASLASADATGGATFLVAAADTTTPGRLLRFRIEFTAPGGYYSRDTVEVLAGTPTLVFEEHGTPGLPAWSITGGWSVVSGEDGHPSGFVSDSPAGPYPALSTARLVRRGPLDLSAGVHAWMLFDARWQFESTFDGLVIEASLDSVVWTPLPGRATVPGWFAPQPAGQPVYSGARWRWGAERVDLSAFAGPAADSVWIRMRLAADGSLQLDGFSFDSLRVLVFDPAQQPEPVAVGDRRPVPRLAFDPPWPNPARDRVRFAFELPDAGPVRLEILDLQGRRVRTLADARLEPRRYAGGWDLADEHGRRVPPGVYLARLSAGPTAVVRRVVALD